MHKTTLTIAIAAALGTGLAVAQMIRSAEVELKAAIQTEEVAGDLKGAIEQYKKIAAKYPANRPVAAMALVHMAECYQKMGDTEARKIYDRVLHDYADQKEAVARARGHLGASASGKGIVSKQVWTSSFQGDAAVSGDGRYLSFVDYATGDLILHDVASGSDRHLTNNGHWTEPKEFAGQSVISRDGLRVAYRWNNGKEDQSEIRILNLEERGLAQPRRLYTDADSDWTAPHDWSPDGKWLAVETQRQDGLYLALLSVADGSLRTLKRVTRGISPEASSFRLTGITWGSTWGRPPGGSTTCLPWRWMDVLRPRLLRVRRMNP